MYATRFFVLFFLCITNSVIFGLIIRYRSEVAVAYAALLKWILMFDFKISYAYYGVDFVYVAQMRGTRLRVERNAVVGDANWWAGSIVVRFFVTHQCWIVPLTRLLRPVVPSSGRDS